MNTWRWTVALVAGGALVAACSVTPKSDDDSDTGSGGSAAGAGGGATTAGPGPGPATGATGATAASTGAGMPMGICGSGLTLGDDDIDACLTASCCDSFNACTGDTDCNACLTNAAAPGCDSNTLYMAYTTCSDTNCPGDFCDTGIGFGTNFACNSCADDAANGCCASATTCIAGGTMPEIQLCLNCMNECTAVDAANGCAGICVVGSAEETAAAEFNTCTQTNCAAECG